MNLKTRKTIMFFIILFSFIAIVYALDFALFENDLVVNGTLKVEGNIFDNDFRVCTASNGFCNQSLVAAGDTNETPRFENLIAFNCTSNDRMDGVFNNGTPSCRAVIDSDTFFPDTNATTECGDNEYLRGDGVCVPLMQDIYNKSQVYPVEDIYNKTEVYNQTEVYPVESLYNQTEVDTRIGSAHDQDLNTTANVTFNSLNITTNLTVFNRINLGNLNHYIKFGSQEPFNGLSNETFIFHHDEGHPAGTMAMAFTHQNRTILAGQVGRNNSAGILGNSWMVIPNNLSTNYTFFSDCFNVMDFLGIPPRIFCDTGDTGSDLLVHDDIQLGGTVFAEDGIRAETIAAFVMNDNDFEVINGTVHILTPVTFTTGFNLSDNLTIFVETFAGTLGNFVNLQTDAGNWESISSALCDDNGCAEANGAESGVINMEANFSTLDIADLNLNFISSIDSLVGGNNLEVTINNNEGSGDVSLFTSVGTYVLNVSQIPLPASMENRSQVSLNFICTSNFASRQCYIDTVNVNGTASANTTASQAGFDGQICFSDGAKDADGICLRGIYYNASADLIQFRGNAESLTVSEETVTGDLTVGGTIIANIITALDWSNVTITESQITDLAHIADTNASTECGNTEFLRGDATCVDESTIGSAPDLSNYVNKTDAENIGGVKNFTTTINATHIEPSGNNTYNLGNTESYWANLYVKTLNLVDLITGSQILDATITKAKLAFEVYDTTQTYNKSEVYPVESLYNQTEIDNLAIEINKSIVQRDTNATTECGNTQYLRGDGVCVEEATLGSAPDLSNYVNKTDAETIAGAKTFSDLFTVLDTALIRLTSWNGAPAILSLHADEGSGFTPNATILNLTAFHSGAGDASSVTAIHIDNQLQGTPAILTAMDIEGDIYFRDLASCNTFDTDASGLLSCGTDETGTGNSPWSFNSGAIFNTTHGVTFGNGTGNFSDTIFILNGTDIRTFDVADTNATTECGDGFLLDGTGNCQAPATIDTNRTDAQIHALAVQHDTNATTECADTEYLRGDGVCVPLMVNIYNKSEVYTVESLYNQTEIDNLAIEINKSIVQRDTNATTECADTEFLRGDGVCIDESTLGSAPDLSNYVNKSDFEVIGGLKNFTDGINTTFLRIGAQGYEFNDISGDNLRLLWGTSRVFQTDFSLGTWTFDNMDILPDDANQFNLGSPSNMWNILYVNITNSTDWTNVTITESQISDLTHTTDTNESVRFDALVNDNCNANEVAIGVYENGTIECRAEAGGAAPDLSNYVNKTDNEEIGGIKNFTQDANFTQNVSIEGSLHADVSTTTGYIWARLTNFPTACGTDETVTGIGATITCSAISILASQISDFNAATDARVVIGDTNRTDAQIHELAVQHDTNATTECGDNDMLRGDGTCVPVVNFDQTVNTTSSVQFEHVNATTMNATYANYTSHIFIGGANLTWNGTNLIINGGS